MFYRKKMKLIAGLVILVLIGMFINRENTMLFNWKLDSRPFRLGLSESIGTLNPAQLSNNSEKTVASMIYEGLIVYDENQHELKKSIARKWSYNKDGMILTIKLDDNRKFHNGKPLSAAGVKNAWEKSFSTCKDMNLLSLFAGIEGYQNRIEGKSDEISGIRVINEKTLEITFVEPNLQFPYTLTNPIFYIYDTEDKNPIGTGAFYIDNRTENLEITLLRNEDYQQKAKLTSIIVNTYSDPHKGLSDYNEGKLDYLDSIPLEAVPDYQNDEQKQKLIINRPLAEIYAFGFNLNRPPFKGNNKLRQAFNYAINREEIVKAAFGGNAIALTQPIPLGMFENDERKGFDFDHKKAVQLLAEAGYPEGRGLPVILISYNANSGHKLIAEMVANDLAEIGVKVRLNSMSWESYIRNLQNGRLDFYRFVWKLDYINVDAALYGLFSSTRQGMSNFNHYENGQVDNLLANARSYKRNAEQANDYAQAIQIITDDAPYLWILQRKSAGIVSSAVRGLVIDGLGNVNWAKVELQKV